GDASGASDPLNVLMTTNKSITATFSAADTLETAIDLGTFYGEGSSEQMAVSSGVLGNGDVDYYSFFVGSPPLRVWAYLDTGGPQGAGATSRASKLTLLGTNGVQILEIDLDNGSGNGLDSTLES